MNIILVMIPLSLILLAAAAFAFFWAVNHGQFDDMQSPGLTPMSDNLPEEDEEGGEGRESEENRPVTNTDINTDSDSK